MDLDIYNTSVCEIFDTIDEEAENRLYNVRKQCVQGLVDRLTKRQQEWNDAYLEILKKSQEIDAESVPFKPPVLQPIVPIKPQPSQPKDTATTKADSQSNNNNNEQRQNVVSQPTKPVTAGEPKSAQPEPAPKEQEFLDPYFSNQYSVKEYLRIRELLENLKNACSDLNTNPNLKQFKNELTMLIRTQINSISNSDSQHLDAKIRLLTNLFNGQGVSFQNKTVNASQHPQGQAFCMFTTAQTFVTVGSRLVNSVPAIANSMAQVIEGIVRNDIPIFKDLVVGHLQERCPYLVPVAPGMDDISDEKDKEVKLRIACGYNYDSSTQTLETEDKYLIRMRSMVLIYACVLLQGHLNETWTWLASFLSLKPQPVISATILQAFLQEASKKMSSTYGRQYQKLINFTRNRYLKMIEEVTPKGVDRQSLIKLKNLLSSDSNVLAAPTMSSIFNKPFF